MDKTNIEPSISTNPAKTHPWAWIPTLYFIQGLPNAVIITLTVILYKDFGISNGKIAFYTGMMYLPWVIKPFWSPFVDIIRTKRWWTVTMQMLMTAAFIGVALFLTTDMFFAATIVLFWLVAFTSATNDISSDGFYMLALTEHQQSYFVGIRSLFYRVSMWIIQFGIIYLAGFLQTRMDSVERAWVIVFIVLAAIFAAGAIYHSFILPHPVKDVSNTAKDAVTILREFGETFATFFRKKHLLTALAFMLLYRFPEAQLVKIINLFLMDPIENGGLGMTKDAISITYGLWGAGGLIIGGILGGVYAARMGLKRSLRPMAWAMSLSCITFVVLSQAESPGRLMVNACVFAEQFGYGFGFSAYMLYLIYFSEGKYATAHYAICTAFMAISLMVPGMVAGWIQETLGYERFFIWTMICCVATIGVAYTVKVDTSFGIKTSNNQKK